MCTDYQCISVIKAVFLQPSQPLCAAAQLSVSVTDRVWSIPVFGCSSRVVAPIRLSVLR